MLPRQTYANQHPHTAQPEATSTPVDRRPLAQILDCPPAQTVIAECDADLSAFPSEKQFTSWLGLVPTNAQSGVKILKRRTLKVVNRAAMAFRNAASMLVRSQSYLGAQYRRLRTRLGAPKAITAMARKLACLFY